MIGHKTSLNKFKKIEIISSTFSYHKGLKLETNLKEKTKKHSNSWRLNSMLLNNECCLLYTSDAADELRGV